ncbi:hypothetical protein Glove_184g77 [Diversispora epigaea]|uniref:valine--tRNA ligase n=1 Tax=Diversispora epigaea TaxID=1348612 RepID=A0A397IX16_9GLOM|nr:hypothetical protein Glove_184g77 [Diversispora epigaea]
MINLLFRHKINLSRHVKFYRFIISLRRRLTSSTIIENNDINKDKDNENYNNKYNNKNKDYIINDTNKVPLKPTRKLDKSYKPILVELGWYDWWEYKGYFGRRGSLARSEHSETRKIENAENTIKIESIKNTEKTKKFLMISPPPNVTGNLHIGHALTFNVQDCLVRWYRMQGYDVSWIPGTDHAGIGTQSVVERYLYKEKSLTRHDLGRENFTKQIWEWRELYGNRIIQQLRRLGASLDWDNLFFTMDPERSKAVNNAFIRMFNDGMIYRDTRLVNWCCALGTVISDIEVEYENITKRTFLKITGRDEKIEFGVLHKIAYPVAEPNTCEIKELIVATTRIETMLGDVALAIHPDDLRYKSLHGKEVIHPLLNRKIPIICDAELVDMEFGTGVVKVTPGHDNNDFACAKRHKLPIINILNKNGTLNENCEISELINKDRFDARKEIINKLQSLGYYHEKVNHEMKIAKCSRSGDIIEPLLQPQWYIKCKEIQQRALRDVQNGEIIIKPSYHTDEWKRLENDQDWCISRQLWWGHQIPVYKLIYKNQESDKELWFAASSMKDAEKLVNDYFDKNNIISKPEYTLKQDEDVLDTWFSSALLPLSALNWNGDQNIPINYPTTMIETGHDILFFWVARMVMLCTYFSGKPPFNKIFLHSIIRDSQGRKMSKSLGNVIDPLHVIEGVTLQELQQNLYKSNLSESEIEKSIKNLSKEFPQGITSCGSDALRFGLIEYTHQTQINLSISNITIIKHFCNKIWNLFKFSNDKFDALNHIPQITCDFISPTKLLSSSSSLSDILDNLSLVDKYILSKLSDTVMKCQKAFEDLELYKATEALRIFIVEELCGVYLEFIKPILHKDLENNNDIEKKTQKTTLKILEICLDSSLRLLHPFMPFITEELWQTLTKRSNNDKNSKIPESIMIVGYPRKDEFECFKDTKVEDDMKTVLNIIHASRSIRQQNNVTQGKLLPFYIWTDIPEFINGKSQIIKYFPNIKGFIKASDIQVISSVESEKNIQMTQLLNNSAFNLIAANLKVYVPMTAILEVQSTSNNVTDTELNRLTQKYEKITKELETLKEGIENATYLKKAPDRVKEIDRKRLENLEELKKDLEKNVKLVQISKE